MAIIRWHAVLLPLLLVWACDQAKVAELEKEVQAQKTEVAALKDKLAQVEAGLKELEAGRQKLEAGLRELAQAREASPPAVPAAPAPGVLTVEQVLKDKERYLNTRVVVRGAPGPVLMHKKILYLTSPAGLLEVNFSNLPDRKQMERLTAQALETPLTVTGTLTQAPGVGKDPSRLQILAEMVEF